MEKIKETTYITKYKAIDGTIFISEDECRKYESSAKGVISWRFRKLIISDEYNAWDLLGGDDDHVIFAVEVKSLEDIDVVLHFLFMENSWLLSGSDASNKRKAFIEDVINKALDQDGIILFGKNCDGDIYFINSRQNLIDNLMNLKKSY